MRPLFLRKLFSKVSHIAKELLREKPLLVSSRQEHIVAIVSGRNHILTEEYREEIAVPTMKRVKAIEERLRGIEQRLSTLEHETT